MKSLHVLLQRFADAGLDFVVVGGFAGVLHGSTYVTEDLDICAVMSPENVAKLRSALADLHPVHRMTHQRLSFLEHPPAGQPLANVYLETDAGVVDVLGSVLGIGDYQALLQHAIAVPLFGRTCHVISMEDLIKAKETLGRDKDKLVAKELRAIQAKRQLGRSEPR
ncbi:nucleotidyltransferase [Oleiharenicola lentus]|jgi:predicted nucleotidyltransferase|uniref:Nucleotidyltransferase n=1 Tax=Oleiharenicola lentus TaxID=2508720 RepID=A0A4Q1C8N5_9BACT|nr:nucleotidyltransferase [Oleiharenicola lentus]RXK55268.1 nucleotidyltransferase [Oleiharenicola lentus]